MRVLGIETSCDDTGVALYDEASGLIGHRLASQAALHAEYGGVVPELASRDHVRVLLPLVTDLLKDAGPGRLDGIAYTEGPGLAGALLVGAAFAHALAYAYRIPAIGIHHLEGHLLAPMLDPNPPEFPFLALLVSGGHTLLVDVAGGGEYRKLGESIDDAAGEAFDKTAQLLGLGYPGGPAVERLAREGRPGPYHFTRPLKESGLDFSFSGLKTQVLLAVRAGLPDRQAASDLARAFQEAVVDVLVTKALRALAQVGRSRLVIAGGVGANGALRAAFDQAAQHAGVSVYYPRLEFCTDNGAMIAYAGIRRLAGSAHRLEFAARPRWSLEDIPPPPA
ncbi:MAG: tRNA (adenosine(37)-N6)-threonylcarbamoyltransferase complex transferase subunit TsaD [Acidiferrobacteraceae bacterium]